MRRDFYLENGIYCRGSFDDFKLYYETLPLTTSCNSIAYIPNRLIALKSGKTVTVYEPRVVNVNGKNLLYEIAKFESKNPNAYLKVKVHDKVYIIDSNVQISLYNHSKLT